MSEKDIGECITAGCARQADPSSLCIACSWTARNRPDTELGGRARAALDARAAPIDWQARLAAALDRIAALEHQLAEVTAERDAAQREAMRNSATARYLESLP